VYLQAALLYTRYTGERRVRVHNLRLQATDNSHDVFRHTDIDALLALLLRKGEWQGAACCCCCAPLASSLQLPHSPHTHHAHAPHPTPHRH
jgi:hypothetical protein